MAQFRVGQRVRRIESPEVTIQPKYGVAPWEGVVVGITFGFLDGSAIDVRYDNGLLAIGCSARRFAPLTDPKADAFIEQVKRWKPEPVKREVNVS